MITFENFAARLVSKSDITDFDGKLKNVNKKVNLNNTKSIKLKRN